MRRAPPIVPGIPDKNSRSFRPSVPATVAIELSRAAAPTSKYPSYKAILVNPLPRRIITPSTPPSRIKRLEPTPMVVYATSLDFAFKKKLDLQSLLVYKIFRSGPNSKPSGWCNDIIFSILSSDLRKVC